MPKRVDKEKLLSYLNAVLEEQRKAWDEANQHIQRAEDYVEEDGQELEQIQGKIWAYEDIIEVVIEHM